MNLTLANAALNLKRRAHRNGRRRDMPALWLMTDDARLTDPRAAAMTLPRGSGIVFRHYAAPDRRTIAAQLADICRKRRLILLIAGDWRLAQEVGADGLHLPEYAALGSLEPGAALWLRQRNRILTVAAHGMNGLHRAKVLRADAAVLSPVFATVSHPGAAHLGSMRTAAYVRKAPTAVIALGGVTSHTINALHETGCAGIAGISFAAEKT